jgi:CTP:molybdopterin cytidylyltransferase MocA
VTPNVAGVLLAAGSGSRLGRPKALVIVAGQSLIERGAALLSGGGAHPVIVVTGAAEPADRPAAAVMVRNPDWATGMGSSLAAGLAAVPPDCTAAVIALADQPLVGAESVRRLIAAAASGAPVAVACYEGRPRNPVLISREHWPAVLALATGDVGARPFLRAHPELVTHVECGDVGRPDDIDSVADLASAERLLAT